MSETRSSATGPIVYLDSQARFDGFMAGIARESLLAVDTEAASFHRYLDRIYLIQVSSRSQTAVVDPLAVGDLTPLGERLAAPEVEIAFHDADYDLRILDRDYGFRATNLFDTRIAAQLLNEPGIGLAALLEKYQGVKLDKRFQRADWSMRPLAPGMLEYAAADTHYLLQLRDILKARLAELRRWSWAAEEFALLEDVRWSSSGPAEEAYLRMKGARALKGRSLAVLREVFAWREAAARQLDRAPFRVLNGEVLLELAELQPADLDALLKVPGLSPENARRRGPELLAAVQRGLASPLETLPKLERGRRPAPDPELDAALERLKSARNAIATRLDLAPGVLCPNGLLEGIARTRPTSLEALGEVPGFRQWQAREFGAELLQAVQEERKPNERG